MQHQNPHLPRRKASLHTGIIAVCFLVVFASPAYTETPDITAYNDMMRNRVDCRARDHECVIKNSQLFYYFVKTYPTSDSTPQVAMFAVRGYEEANEILRNKGRFSEAIQYETLAKEMRALVTHEPVIINPAPRQQTVQTPTPTAQLSEPSKSVPQPASPQTTPAPSSSQRNILQEIDATALIVLSLIAITASTVILLFYRPNDLHPRSYDPLKWFAVLLGFNGIHHRTLSFY